ncbi:uncharacterized protein RAG0_00994 [Rhynchosporium agropyri]|uniref:Uncharacterized protein n=3 Tax=Rhynchosporium TaxID=38037 RepID=A0A1E1MFL0_RHYSE|nr:uncharacterized protein RAG0_00994 [Rhynchosporium agropyri]CZT02576.1 uncharacterized protein RCO7_14697 [Rhynchosporium commune]CZT47505.1 uncharacterized protein RSE6_08074 [Rhynchosporium secalis]
MVSLEHISQGQMISRLNFLALNSLPALFYSYSIWYDWLYSCTRWYPAYALLLLTATFVLAILMPNLNST